MHATWNRCLEHGAGCLVLLLFLPLYSLCWCYSCQNLRVGFTGRLIIASWSSSALSPSVWYPVLIFTFFSFQDEKAKAIAVLERIYESDRLEEEVELLATSSMHEFQSNNTGSYLDVFKSKELRLAFFAGAGLQVCSSACLLVRWFVRALFSFSCQWSRYSTWLHVLLSRFSWRIKQATGRYLFSHLGLSKPCRPSSNLPGSTPWCITAPR